MLDEIAVGGPCALRDLFFSPAVQAIPHSGLSANIRRFQTGLFDDEVFGFTIACVVLNPVLQTEATFNVLRTRPAQRTLRGQHRIARPQEHDDGLLELVFSQLRRGGDADAPGEVLQLLAIPITVFEVAQRHRRERAVAIGSAVFEVLAINRTAPAISRN